eukprot:scaffold1220_cov259-Pinguiococcus_pyrenoidosus.AAC.42
MTLAPKATQAARSACSSLMPTYIDRTESSIPDANVMGCSRKAPLGVDEPGEPRVHRRCHFHELPDDSFPLLCTRVVGLSCAGVALQSVQQAFHGQQQGGRIRDADLLISELVRHPRPGALAQHLLPRNPPALLSVVEDVDKRMRLLVKISVSRRLGSCFRDGCRPVQLRLRRAFANWAMEEAEPVGQNLYAEQLIERIQHEKVEAFVPEEAPGEERPRRQSTGPRSSPYPPAGLTAPPGPPFSPGRWHPWHIGRRTPRSVGGTAAAPPQGRHQRRGKRLRAQSTPVHRR